MPAKPSSGRSSRTREEVGHGRVRDEGLRAVEDVPIRRRRPRSSQREGVGAGARLAHPVRRDRATPSQRPGRYRRFCSSVPKRSDRRSQAHICALREKTARCRCSRSRAPRVPRSSSPRAAAPVLLRYREPEQAEVGALLPGLARKASASAAVRRARPARSRRRTRKAAADRRRGGTDPPRCGASACSLVAPFGSGQ